MSAPSRLALQRICADDEATFGALYLVQEAGAVRPLAVTLELPWRNNARRVSCIPAGVYKLDIFYHSPIYGVVPLVENVPGRDGILLHAGNLPEDTKGCIIVGSRFGLLDHQDAVLRSKLMFEDVQRILAAAFPGGRCDFHIHHAPEQL